MKPSITKNDREYLRKHLVIVLQSHKGRAAAITSRGLAAAMGIKHDDRRIRLIIRELIADGIPIASAVSGEPKGYFIVKTQDEAREYVASLTARIREDSSRLRDFEIASQLKGARPGQLALI